MAKFVISSLGNIPCVTTELLDLKELNLPMMEERLRFRTDPPSPVSDLSTKVDRADSIVIVTPEYNSGYPGVLKNALDYLKDEYRRKPFGIITVSAAWSGGILCLASLRQVILHLGGIPIRPARRHALCDGRPARKGEGRSRCEEDPGQRHFQHSTWVLLAAARSARCVTGNSRAAASAGS